MQFRNIGAIYLQMANLICEKDYEGMEVGR
jgi:hypothetical protein